MLGKKFSWVCPWSTKALAGTSTSGVGRGSGERGGAKEAAGRGWILWHHGTAVTQGRASRTQRKLAGTGFALCQAKALCSASINYRRERKKIQEPEKPQLSQHMPLGLSAFGKGTYLYMGGRHLMKEDLGNRRKLKITPEIGWGSHRSLPKSSVNSSWVDDRWRRHSTPTHGVFSIVSGI